MALPRVRRKVFKATAIIAGYPWSLRFRFPNITIPASAVVISDVKRTVNDLGALVRLTTANGSLIRVDPNTIDVSITGAVSLDWEEGEVMFDFVLPQTNTYIGVKAVVPVRRPVTLSGT